MADRAILVSAQWALEGKQPDGEDYHILSCSTGELNREHFADALDRFQLGELNDLPQVSVSYARLGAQPGTSHIALAIHWNAREGQYHADGVGQRDNQGRITTFTSYFCLPYKTLAAEGIGYLAMYEALSSVTLTVADGPPLDVPVAVPTSHIPAADDLAVRVAPLLLTRRPVCVLGAENVHWLERLKFIDAVMNCLPYGFRSRMTAATWTRPTNRNHGFRLFFGSAVRAGDQDWVVAWGDGPDLVPVPDGKAGEYLEWLQGNIDPLARLADLGDERGFGERDILQGIEAADGTQHRRSFRPRVQAPAPNGKPGRPGPPPGSTVGDPGERRLRECADHVQLSSRGKLNSDITFLRRLSENGLDEDRRNHYRNVINDLGLLREGFLLGDKAKYADRLYDALLRVAFEIPLSYDAYCWVEKLAGVSPGRAPHPELIGAVDKAGVAGLAVGAIVRWHSRTADKEKKLNKWLISDEVKAADLIKLVAGKWGHPHHGQVLCAVTLDFLRKAAKCYQTQEVRDALCAHGFLAPAIRNLYPDDEERQIRVLRQFLEAAYPQPSRTPGQELSRAAIVQILSSASGPPPTPALLGAVLMQLNKPISWELAWMAYARGSLNLPHLDPKILVDLRGRLPDIGAAEINAIGSQPAVKPALRAPDPVGWPASGPAQ